MQIICCLHCLGMTWSQPLGRECSPLFIIQRDCGWREYGAKGHDSCVTGSSSCLSLLGVNVCVCVHFHSSIVSHILNVMRHISPSPFIQKQFGGAFPQESIGHVLHQEHVSEVYRI